MSDFSIRPTTPDDYEAIADLVNATHPPIPAQASVIRQTDAQRPAYCKIARWLAEHDGRVVGFSLFEQSPYNYDPEAVQVMVRVHPEFEGRGIGQALYATVEQAANIERMRIFRSHVSENEARSLDFASRLGFAEERRLFESTLDVPAFDPTLFAHLIPALAAQGIEIRPYSEIKGDSTLDHAIYDLTTNTLTDIPSTVPYTVPDFEVFCEQTFQNSTIPHEGILVALAHNEVVGITFHRVYNGEQMNVNFSGVRRDYRGRGLALALKVAGVRFAQTYGTQILRTTNDSTNPSILALNRKLGFVPRPALLMLKKQLTVDS